VNANAKQTISRTKCLLMLGFITKPEPKEK
jgi:hypothetical protein